MQLKYRQHWKKEIMMQLIAVQRNAAGIPAYIANVKYTSASLDKGNILKSILNNLLVYPKYQRYQTYGGRT